ncbi:MAG: hypothetical protein ACTTHU_08955 [Treponema sp.]
MKLKKFASIGALITLLVSAAFIVGCKQDANSGGGGGGSTANNPFIGTWERSDGGYFYKLVFDATTVTDYYKTSASGDWQFRASAPYTFSGNTATPQVSGGTPYTFTVSGNTLMISNGTIFYKK